MASPFIFPVVVVVVNSFLCGSVANGNWCMSNYMSGENNSKPCSDKMGQNNCQTEGNQSSPNMGGQWSSMCCGACSSPMDSWGYNGCSWPMCNGFSQQMGPYGGMFGCGGMYPGFSNVCPGFANMCHGQGKMQFNQANMSHGPNSCDMCHGQGNMCHGFGPMFNGCHMNPFSNSMFNNMCWNHPMWYNNYACMNGHWGSPFSFSNNWGGGMSNCNSMNSSGPNFGNGNNQQAACENKSSQPGTFNGCMNNCKSMDNNQGSHLKCHHNTYNPNNNNNNNNNNINNNNNNGYSSCKGNSNFMARNSYCQ